MQENMLGAYGAWAAALVGEGPAALSFRNPAWADLDHWRVEARRRVLDCLAPPDSGPMPAVTVQRRYHYDGLQIEELTWQLPYGPPTEAVLLKPAGAAGPLPGIVALHDHGGNKYLGKRKISRVDDTPHPLALAHQDQYYGGVAWANELAKRGYVVLVHDAFAFASRRIHLSDVPAQIRGGLSETDLEHPDPEHPDQIDAYNQWAAGHESIMAKSLLCAGTTWPGVFLAEDQRAVDVLSARAEVDETRIGCAGLSGGGLRTVYLGGLDPRIRCAVCVGMMSTWRDYLLHKSHTHTWMIYIPHLPRELDYPEILGLRAPQPTMVLNDIDDQLFTMPEMERADAMLRQVFDKAGRPERYQSHFYPGPHKFDLTMQADAFAWFDRWLKETG